MAGARETEGRKFKKMDEIKRNKKESVV